jgi:hypothetical protein
MSNLFGPPTISFCEKPTGSFIRRPYYALSNFAFFLTGYLILKEKTKLSNIFGFTAILVGLLSFVYDSSYTYLSQLFDLSGMILFISIPLYLNFSKIFKTKKLLLIQTLVGLFSIIAIYLLKGYSGDFIFGAFVLTLTISEIYLQRNGSHKNFKKWLIIFTLFVLSFGIWIIDAKQIICLNFGLLNGRSIFHYINALNIYLLYKFYLKQ